MLRFMVTSSWIIHFQDKKITISNSIVLGAVNLVGGVTSGPLEIKGSTLKSGIFLPKRGNYTIYNNILLDAIQVSPSDISDWGDPGPNPNISGNSFLGKSAIYGGIVGFNWPKSIHHKIPLGCSFFGHPQGFTPAWDNHPISMEPAFLHYKGSYVDETVALVDCLETDGTYPPSQVFPKIWAVQWIVGQNALDHDQPSFGDKDNILMDRNSLLSVDIRATVQELKGARFYVVFNGQTIDSEPTVVRRGQDTYLGSKGFKNTVNFILPPVAPGQEAINLDFVVYADVSQVSGDLARAGNPIWLTAGSIKFVPPPKRKFKVSVSPVHVYGGCSGKGSTADILANIKDYLGAMFPIRQKDIAVSMGIPNSFFCGPVSAVSATGFWTALSAELGIASGISGTTSQYDRVIMAVPKAASGLNIEGANSAVNSKVLLVREDKPLAVVHEMGHSLGLGDQYTSTIHGTPLTGMTAFDPDSNGVNGIRPGQHFSKYETSSSPMYDIMADNDYIWTWIKGSYPYFKNYFQTFVRAAVDPSADLRAPSRLSGPGERQVLITAEMLQSGPYPNFFPKMKFDTLKVMDITGAGLNPTNSPEHTWDDRFYAYSVEGLDASGQSLSYHWLLPHSYYLYYYKTLIIPAAVTTLKINGGHPDHVATLQKSSSFSATLISPMNGTTLGDTLTLQWIQSNPDLLHLVLVSTDGGNTWEAIGAPFQGHQPGIFHGIPAFRDAYFHQGNLL